MWPARSMKPALPSSTTAARPSRERSGMFEPRFDHCAAGRVDVASLAVNDHCGQALGEIFGPIELRRNRYASPGIDEAISGIDLNGSKTLREITGPIELRRNHQASSGVDEAGLAAQSHSS